MQVGALFAYPSAQCTGRFFAVVRTLLPVRIAELLFCVPMCAPKRQVRAHSDANGPVCVLKCAGLSFRRALRNAFMCYLAVCGGGLIIADYSG